MNLTCDIVMDLIPLYRDNAASADTVKAVEEHLKSCPACRVYCSRYHSENYKKETPPSPQEMEARMNRGYAFLATKMKKRQSISIAAISAVICVSSAAAIFSTLRLLRRENLI